ncbi:Transmembrane emp24 domain-containing protein p24beta2 [Hibiscus syriacus]|uniref:Transmembrane emp24 domain-containing protein p24beta2 n=2 Tax=Hibiscus syriacus TaxID=106335 RepID=A0A6A2YEF8_HIBSY|nr:Transmembrane emp24 domain-containing protein p24beta2 [Hibiscus syriacus]
MASTESAKAGIRSQSATRQRQRPSTPERDRIASAKKRLSFPVPGLYDIGMGYGSYSYSLTILLIVSRALAIKGPLGDQIHDFQNKISDKHEFVVHEQGAYKSCFTNNSPYHETIDFDIQVGHLQHIDPLMDQISRLEEALYNIQFEQHWIESQTDRQAIVNDNLERRALHKAMFESAALIAASVLQVFLLKRMFKRKLGTSRV